MKRSIKTKKRIGFLLGSLSGAGAEKTILTLATSFAEQNIEVDLYLLKPNSDYIPHKKLNIHKLSARSSLIKKIQLFYLTSIAKYDLFISSRAEYYPFVKAKKVYCSVHITPTAWLSDKQRNPKQINKLKKKFANKQLISLSQGIKDDLVDNLDCDANNIKVISNPYNIESISLKSSSTDNLPNYEYLIYVASFIPRKRHIDLIKAFSNIKDKKIRLLLVGKGPLEEQLKSLILDLNLDNRIIFWGWDKNPYRLIKNAKLSLLCSEAEGLPRVLVESLIIGTPVVSTNCPSGPNEVLVNEFSNFLVAVGDVKALTNQINVALSDYPSIDSLGLSRFDSNKVMLEYASLMTTK